MSDSIDVPCPSCGETTAADCHVKCRSCGYETPGMRRVAAIKANPEKSNVEIAKDLGEDPETVRRARKRLTQNAEVLEGRTGRAAPRGKRERKALTPTVEPATTPTADSMLCPLPDYAKNPTAAQLAVTANRWYIHAYNATNIVDAAMEHMQSDPLPDMDAFIDSAVLRALGEAERNFTQFMPVTDKMLASIKLVIAKWQHLHTYLERKRNEQA